MYVIKDSQSNILQHVNILQGQSFITIPRYIMSPLLDSCQYWMDWMVDSCCGKVRDKSKLQARKQPRSPDARNAPSNLIDGNNILKRLEKERRIIKPPRSKNSKKNFKTHSHQAGQKKGRVMVRKVIVEGREFAVKDDSAADGEDEDEDSKKNLNKIVKLVKQYTFQNNI